uniref:Uncharacterized protein n=1 Tax=Arundo donax TaxID=35708 RepID=A0A0A8XWX6_ARUDO
MFSAQSARGKSFVSSIWHFFFPRGRSFSILGHKW